MTKFLIIIFSVLCGLVLPRLSFADDGVHVSGDYSNRYQQQSVQTDIKKTVMESYRQYVQELIRKALTQPQLRIEEAVIQQSTMEAVLETIRRPEVQKIIQEVFVHGMQTAFGQIKLKSTRQVMDQKVQAVIDQDIKKIALQQPFQKSLDKVIRQTIGQHTQQDLQQAISQQQQQLQQQMASQQQAMEQQYLNSIEKILAEKK